MIILTHEISIKTELYIDRIQKQLNKPIIYKKIDNKDSGFGRCGQNSYSFLVWLDDSLPDEAFEINALHELVHLTQMLKNVPDARPINENADGENKMAQSINALIFDIEVENTLKEYGFDTIYFTYIRLEQMKEIRSKGFVNYANNEFVQKYAAIRLALYSYVASEEISESMYNIFHKRYPRICSTAKRLTNLIQNKPLKETSEMFETMKQIIELLHIGDHIKIVYEGKEHLYDNNCWSNC